MFDPVHTVNRPRIAGLFDGSTQAFAVVIYAFKMVNKDNSRNKDGDHAEGDLMDKIFNPNIHSCVSSIISTKVKVMPLKDAFTIL